MWYTPEYPEEIFFDHWAFMAERYLANPLVIGADLRNEVRGIKGKRHTCGLETIDFFFTNSTCAATRRQT